jgi:hypothetical protein
MAVFRGSNDFSTWIKKSNSPFGLS